MTRGTVDDELGISVVDEARGRAIAKLLGALPASPDGPMTAVRLEHRRPVADVRPHFLGELVDAAYRENA